MIFCARATRGLGRPLVGHAQWETHLARPQGNGYRLAKIAGNLADHAATISCRLK